MAEADLGFNKTIENLFECGGGMDMHTVSKLASQAPTQQLIGGKGDRRNVEEFDPAQVVKGIKVEMEHSHDVRAVLEIVVDHLTEDPTYYDKLETIHVD